MTLLASTLTLGSSRLSSGTKPIQAWLFIVAAFVYAMVLVGGATRLTGSGLSITEWQPILGAVPPLSATAWQDAFDKYRHIPEYELVNKGMTLDAFKTLYWWEWGHRLLGRLIGAVFLVPFLFFLIRGSIPKSYVGRVAALFVLGGAQGALGWFMVKSGLSERVDVSQYRLAAHLALAVAIASYAFWLALSLGRTESRHAATDASARRWLAYATAAMAGVVYLQIVMGGFVAGLKAGHASNTWPLMNGEFIPSGLDFYSPFYLNVFENPIGAQFVHRMVAYAAAILAGGLALVIWRSPSGLGLRGPALALVAAVALQIVLGVATVVYDVPIGLALAHQANGVILLAVALWMVRRATASRGYAAESA
jgi:cytochrome c oxidase assembly protein subunit 15